MKIWAGTAFLLMCQGTAGLLADVTFTRDVAPILYRHCTVCHRADDIAPMSLVTYQEVRPWAAAIRESVLTGKMPPWHADPHYGTFSNDAGLSESEIGAINSWVKQGAKEGNTNDLPSPPVFEHGWHIKPDAVVSLPEENIIESAGSDKYVYVFVPTDFKEDKWIQAAEVLPGNRRVVHHATVAILSPDKVRSRRGGGDRYRYSTGNLLHLRPEVPVIDDGCSVPDGGALPGETPEPVRVPAVFLPGHLPDVRPEGYAMRLPAGSVLQFQIHYSNSTRKVASDRTSIGFVFADTPPKREVVQYEIWNNMFAIPPRAANHRVTACFTLDQDVEAVAYTAHMHYRGKDMTTEAVYPDGRREILFSVPKYDFRWQETYFLKNTVRLPAGTRLVTTAHFDNSSGNPLNPDPNKLIRWGEPSDEEMVGFWLEYAQPVLDTVTSANAQDAKQ
jgi:hypothetical protein